MQLNNCTKSILAKTAVAAGSTDITDATAIDTQGYGGVRFTFLIGTMTGGTVVSVAAAGKATNAPTPGTDDLAGSKIAVADTQSDKIVCLDIYRPQQRYVRPFVKRATQNCVINGIIAELYDPIKLPTDTDASLSGQETWSSPAVGTA